MFLNFFLFLQHHKIIKMNNYLQKILLISLVFFSFSIFAQSVPKTDENTIPLNPRFVFGSNFYNYQGGAPRARVPKVHRRTYRKGRTR